MLNGEGWFGSGLSLALLAITCRIPTVGAQEPVRILAELTEGEPDRRRILEIGLAARELPTSELRIAVAEALQRFEGRMLESTFGALPGDDPVADRLRFARVDTGLEIPFPRVRATRIAGWMITLGPEPSVEELAGDLESGLPSRRFAALLVARDERHLLTQLADPISRLLRDDLGGPRGGAVARGGSRIAVPDQRDLRCLAGQSLLEIGTSDDLAEEALSYLLRHGDAEQRRFALQSLAIEALPARRLRWSLLRTLASRSAPDRELCAALVALAAVGIPPRDEWPPGPAILRRWLRRGGADEAQRALARECLGWVGPRDAEALGIVEAVAGQERRPRAAAMAAQILPALREQVGG